LDIALHLGAHRTDEDRILRSLAAERKALAAHGTLVPGGAHARPLIRKALRGSERAILPPGGATLVREIAADADGTRMVLSYEAFLGTHQEVLSGEAYYPAAGEKARELVDLFDGHRVELFLGLRNPATAIPAIYAASGEGDLGAFLEGSDVRRASWAPAVAAIRAACPDCPLTVWCTEDLPLIWPEVLRAISGVDGPHGADLAILKEVMTPAGFGRLEAYLADNPPKNAVMWRKVVAAFLGKYADPATLDEEIALQGWTQDLIAALTARYEADVAGLRARDDLTFIAP
jgi:hypothetical protein